jgi:hypothetical protein
VRKITLLAAKRGWLPTEIAWKKSLIDAGVE